MECKDCLSGAEKLLSMPVQMWLLGAGASFDAGIPLMCALTDRVGAVLPGEHGQLFSLIRSDLPRSCHVEHILSALGDYTSLARRSKSGTALIGGEETSTADLLSLHAAIRHHIREIIRYGYRPGRDGVDEEIGTAAKPIVKIDGYLSFVEALFRHRRAGLERRPPLSFFTTNYDTLIEDSLALSRVRTFDGFSGGAMAFWDPSIMLEPLLPEKHTAQALIYKLHGSIDWHLSDEDIVVRRREGAGYPDGSTDTLLIYPQDTKYRITQRDPFASLFGAFRRALETRGSPVLLVCGYSFGDDHINEDIERAMRRRDNQLTLLAFVKQDDQHVGEPSRGLPAALVNWLGTPNSGWNDKIWVAGSRGVYHGNLDNLCPCDADSLHTWWTFAGLTSALRNGLEAEQ